MSINGDQADAGDVELEVDPELWSKIERSNSMERVNGSPLWQGLVPPVKPSFKWGEECSDCDSDNGLAHCLGVCECRVCIVNLIVVPICLGYLSYFTWMNPDQNECWIGPDNDTAYSESPGLPGYTDIAAKLHTWFLLGVILTSIYLINTIAQTIYFLSL